MILAKQAAVALLMLCCSLAVHAYVGPGLGLGVIGVILGILGAMVLTVRVSPVADRASCDADERSKARPRRNPFHADRRALL